MMLTWENCSATLSTTSPKRTAIITPLFLKYFSHWGVLQFIEFVTTDAIEHDSERN